MSSTEETRSLILRKGAEFHMAVDRARLDITAGPDAGEAFEVGSESLLIGRGEDCAVRLRDPSVSRHHLRITPEAGCWRFEDLGSKTGTLVRGVRVERVRVSEDVRVRIGETTLEFRVLRETVPVSPQDGFGGLLGRSAAMRGVFGLLARVAPLDLPVLLTGESGTGKEEVARLLHEQGARPDGPFQVVDCTLLDREHLRSELFGHVKGAFTGAAEERRGAFELADGGTLLLDEIGELPLDLQPTLLRVLESGEVQPLGASRTRRVETRLVSATNRDLAAMVAAGSFRSDLFYRLASVTVPLPPLRDRDDDVLQLAEAFLTEGVELSEAARDRLRRHPWPGNVRELRNVIRRAAALAEGGLVDGRDLGLAEGAPPPGVGEAPMEAPPFRPPADLSEEQRIRAALAHFHGNRLLAAEALGISRSTLWRKMRKFGIA